MHIRRFLTVSVLVAFSFLAVSGPGATLAQDATPVAECTAPELPPGEPTPMDEGSPVAEEASPVAEGEDAAPPAEEEEPFVAEGPVRPVTLEAAQAGLENLVACLAAGEHLKAAALLTPDFVAYLTGTGNPYDVPLTLEAAGTPRIVAMGEAVGDQDHRIGLHVVLGDFFNPPGTLVSERWYFVQDGDFWKLDEAVPVPTPEGFMPEATIVEVEMVDFAFALSANEIPAGPVILRFINTSYTHSPHVAGVVTLTEETSAETIIQAEALPEDEVAGFFGSLFAEPGQSVDLIFENLEPGTYTLACDFTTESNTPHWQLGMVAQFDVV
jgi:plastocyanin